MNKYTVLTNAKVLITTDGTKRLAINTGNEIIPINTMVFDFAAMGLPPIPLTGNRVHCNTDTSALIEAFENGPVKARCLIDLGGEEPVPLTCHMTCAYFPGQYQAMIIGRWGNTIFALIFEMDGSHIFAQMIPIANP